MKVLKVIGGGIVMFAGVLIGIVGYNYPAQFHPIITFGDMATLLSLIVVAFFTIVKGGNLIIDGIMEKK